MNTEEIKIVLIDLDRTIWRFDSWASKILSKQQVESMLMPNAVDVIKSLKNKGYKVGIASASPAAEICKNYLSYIFEKNFFDIIVIHPSYPSKRYHIEETKKKFNCEYKNILLIDDLQTIIDDANEVGIKTIHTPSGISQEAIQQII